MPSEGVHGRARQSPARELRGGGHVAHLSGVGAQDRRGRLTIEGSRSVNNIIRGRERRIGEPTLGSARRFTARVTISPSRGPKAERRREEKRREEGEREREKHRDVAKCCARIALALRRATHARHLHRCPLFPWTLFLYQKQPSRRARRLRQSASRSPPLAEWTKCQECGAMTKRQWSASWGVQWYSSVGLPLGRASSVRYLRCCDRS